MRRFRFRLERVLRVRQQRERLAELKQLEARLALEAAEREVHAAQQRLCDSAAAADARIGRPIDPESLRSQLQLVTQLRRAVDDAHGAVQRAQRALADANRGRKAAATDFEAVMYLKNSQWQRHQHETARREQNQADDMWLQRRPETEPPPGPACETEKP